MVDTYGYMMINGNTRWRCEEPRLEKRRYENPLELYDPLAQPPSIDELPIIPLPWQKSCLNGGKKDNGNM